MITFPYDITAAIEKIGAAYKRNADTARAAVLLDAAAAARSRGDASTANKYTAAVESLLLDTSGRMR